MESQHILTIILFLFKSILQLLYFDFKLEAPLGRTLLKGIHVMLPICEGDHGPISYLSVNVTSIYLVLQVIFKQHLC